MFQIRREQPPLAWLGDPVRIRISLGDSETYYAGILRGLHDDGILLETDRINVFIPYPSVVSIEKEREGRA